MPTNQPNIFLEMGKRERESKEFCFSFPKKRKLNVENGNNT